MVTIYVKKVMNEEMFPEDVPSLWRKKVEAELKEKGWVDPRSNG